MPLLSSLGKAARHALLRHSLSAGHAAVLGAIPRLDDGGEVVRPRGVTGQIVGIDCAMAERMAARAGLAVIFRVRVGDGIAPGTAVADVSAGAVGEQFDRCVIVHRERSLNYDPLYALRILTDVGLRALFRRSMTRQQRSARWTKPKRY